MELVKNILFINFSLSKDQNKDKESYKKKKDYFIIWVFIK